MTSRFVFTDDYFYKSQSQSYPVSGYDSLLLFTCKLKVIFQSDAWNFYFDFSLNPRFFDPADPFLQFIRGVSWPPSSAANAQS